MGFTFQKRDRSLPQEDFDPATFRRLITTMFAAAAIVVLLNCLAGIYLSDQRGNRGYALIRQKWQLLIDLKEPVDILILGDSTCNQGVVPSVVNNRLGKTSINLCTVGNMLLVNDVWMLDYYLSKYDSLSSVILVHAYDIWSRSLSPVAVAQVPLHWGFWDRLKPTINFEWLQLGKLIVARYFHLVAQKTSLSNAIMY